MTECVTCMNNQQRPAPAELRVAQVPALLRSTGILPEALPACGLSSGKLRINSIWQVFEHCSIHISG